VTDGDLIRRFLFERWPVRGQFVRLDASWRAVVEHHDYPPAIRAALGEAMAAAVVLTGTLKFEGQLSLQFQGPGPVHLLLAQCTHRHAIRGVARWRGEAPAAGSLAELTGGGQLAVTIENEARSDRYQGIVPLDQAHLAGCLEEYFARSEQLPTRLVLASDGEHAAGLLLQRVASGAGASFEEDERAVAAAEDAWHRIGLLLDTLTPAELLTLPLQTLLHRLFNEDDLRLFEGSPVFFQCTCSRERVSGILRSLGEAEVRDILCERGDVEVRCEFCNRLWTFDAVDAAGLFAGQPQATARGLH
jgi:molecular chaperone Hsp33